MKVTKLVSDSFWNLLASIIPLVCVLVSIPLLKANLLPTDFFYITSLIAIYGVMTISDFGIGRITTTNLLKACNLDVELRNVIMLSGLITSLILSIIVSIVSYILVIYLLTVSGTIALIASITVFCTIFFSFFKGVLESEGRFYRLLYYKVIVSGLLYLAPALYAYHVDEAGITSIALSMLLPRFLLILGLTIHTLRILNFKGVKLNFKPYFKLGLYSFFSNIFSISLTSFDRFILMRLAPGPILAAYLSVFDVLFRSTVVTGSVLQAGYKFMVTKNDQFTKYFDIVIIAVYLVVLAGYSFFSEAVVEYWLGVNNPEIYYGGMLIIVSVMLNSLAQVSYYKLLAKDMQKIIFKIHFFEFLAFLPLAYFFVQEWGIVGGALVMMLRNIVDLICLRFVEVRC